MMQVSGNPITCEPGKQLQSLPDSFRKGDNQAVGQDIQIAPRHCVDCEVGTYNLGSGKCFECNDHQAVCRGGYQIQPKPGYWRAPPYYESCFNYTINEITSAPTNVPKLRRAKGKAASSPSPLSRGKHMTAAPLTPFTGQTTLPAKISSTGSCPEPFSSAQSLVDQSGGKASIFRCPGGAVACPDSGDGTGTSRACGEGYHGPACALCKPGLPLTCIKFEVIHPWAMAGLQVVCK